ncbi:MAG TPA: hypothetical protein VMV72_13505 [Verrucomicrobiae bacterium]|nr:hypothetical protein [Verrucomicrobiae bacterium]
MSSLFVGMLIVYVISWTLMAYRGYGIGGAVAYGSWQYTYVHFTETSAMALALIVSTLSMLLFAVAFFARQRFALAKIALVAIALALIGALALPAIN